MRVSKAFFAGHAHQKYLDGLVETGISIEKIPLISDMDQKLSAFGWRAVPIVGFIPPAAFMEFLSLGVLPIACDMRTPEHLAYTPAPDIVHEAAGHAPIIADPAFADYLACYGEIARKVIFSDQDMTVYEAIRALSDLKEDPQATQNDIQQAEKKLNESLAAVDWVSEATVLGRMGWWTFEYGLVGDLKNPKIYGAGLLSSIGESYHCLSDRVKKIPFSIDCTNYSFDITKPQPQLFVTPNFDVLGVELQKLASKMAFKVGGLKALKTAIRARTVTTSVLDSDLQLSGKLVEVLEDKTNGEPTYLRFEGPVQIAQGDVELDGQGARYHAHGYSTPIGTLRSLNKSPAELSDEEIQKLNGRFEFNSGVVVNGTVKSVVRRLGRVVLIAFENCTVKFGDRILFSPEWGTFDMACGARVVSVFGGAADRGAYLNATGGFGQKQPRPKTNLTEANKGLIPLYQSVRAWRESKAVDPKKIEDLIAQLDSSYPDDWLLRLELLEFKGPWQTALRQRLEKLSKQHPECSELISRGLALL